MTRSLKEYFEDRFEPEPRDNVKSVGCTFYILWSISFEQRLLLMQTIEI